MSDHIKVVLPKKPASRDEIITRLRDLIELAYREKILYIDVAYKTNSDKMIQGFELNDTTHLRE